MDVYDFLAKTARAAGAELMRRAGTDLQTSLKPDASLVTEADLASEKLILDQISKFFPNDTILSEESGETSGSGKHVWVVDPLDGTTNYANGYPFFCVSIARGHYAASGRIVIDHGAVYDPSRDRLYAAERGKGATVNDKPIKASATRPFASCFLVTGFYYMRDDTLRREIERFGKVAQSCQAIRRDGAAALDLALVAEGVFDAFWEAGLAPWDVAAGSLLVEEAGGAVRNYAVDPAGYDIHGHGLIAGNAAAVANIASLL